MFKLFNTNLIKTFIVSISIGLWCINFFYVHKDKPMLFRIAKGFGLNLRCWPIFLYGTMLRSLLNGTLEKHVVYHKFIGYIMMIACFGHSIAHMIYSRIVDIEHVTGYILLSLFILICAGYLSRSYNYSLFKYTHYIYYIVLPLMIIHVTKYWIWFGIPLIVFTVELFLNLQKTQYSSIKNVYRQGDHMFVSVPRIIDSIPGSYYYLCVPSFTRIFGYDVYIPYMGLTEWHPFSLCSSSHINHLTFMIEAKGDWTKKFYDIVSSNTGDINLMVMGPFRTSSSKCMNADVDKKTIICTGIGITPFLSIINTKIDNYQPNDNYRNDYSEIFENDIEQQRAFSVFGSYKDISEIVTYKSESLDIYWTFRDLNKVKNFFKYVRKMLMRSTNINLHIYITAKMDETSRKEFTEKYQSHGIKSINFCRMDLEILNEENIKQIYFCGSPNVRTAVKDYCNKQGIEFFSEVFSS